MTNADRLPWFKCYPVKLLGALAGMEPAEGYVYVIVLLRQYEVGGPISDDDRTLARRTGLSPRKVTEAIARLCLIEKLVRTSDGRLSNPFAEEIIEDAKTDKISSSEHGRAGANARWGKHQQNQQTDDARAMPGLFDDNVDGEPGYADIRGETEERKEPSPAGGRTPYPPDFESFWLSYPRTPVMSKKQAWDSWRRLSPADRVLAAQAVPGYVAFLRSKPDHPAVHACRFLSQRRFDGFAEQEVTHARAREAASNKVYLKQDDARFKQWDEYLRATRGRGAPVDANGGWWFDSEEPPPILEAAE
jgi:uncharacterized protein YdaU (DUF1376 family)